MANNERIDDIISPEAFAQVDELLKKLGLLQTEYGDLAKSIAATNAEISKSTSIKELNDAVKDSAKEFENLEKAQVKITKVRQEADKAEKQLIQTAKEKLSIDKNAKQLIEQYAGSYDFLIRRQLEIKVTMKQLTAEQKALDSAVKAGTVSSEEYAERTGEIAVALAEGRQAVTDFNLEIRRSMKEATAVEGSYDSVSASLDRMRGLYKRLSEEERANEEIGGVLLKQITETDEQLKALDKSMGVTTREVGSYRKAIDEALSETGLFSREINALKQFKQGYNAVTKVATITTQGFGKALIGIGLGIILIIVGSLIAYFSRMQKGMDLLSQATAGLGVFVGVLLDAFTSLGEQIADNVIPILTGLGKVLLGLATGNLAKIKEGFNEVGDAVQNIDPVKLDELAGSAIKAGIEAGKLAGQMQNIVREQKQIDLLRSRSRADIEALKFIAEDQTKSALEREEATKKGLELEQSLLAKSIALKERELEVQRKQNALTISNDADINKEIDLEIELNDLRQESTTKQIELNNKLNEIRKSEQARLSAVAKEREAREEKAQKEAIARAKKISDAEFNLENDRLKRSIDRNKAVADDEKLGLEDRLSNLEQFLENSEKAIILARDKELANEDLLENDRIRIKENAEAEIANLKIEGAKTAENILMDQLEGEEKIRAEIAKREIDQIKTREAEKLTQLQEQLNGGLITQKSYEEQRLAIIEAFGRQVMEAEIRSVQAIIDANKKKGIDVTEEERKLAELKQSLSEETTAKTLADLEKIEEKEKELKKLQGELATELFNLGVALIDARFQKQEDQLKADAGEVEARKEREIADIEATVLNEEEKELRISNAEKKAQLEREKIAEKDRQLKVKKAKFDKVLAIAGIIRSTAQAIMTQLAGAPLFPISGPLIPIIAGIGAAQIAQVVAQKIPAFKDGTKYSPEGIAIVGEEGAELRINPDGTRELTPNQASLTYLKKGTQIIDHKQTMKMMDTKRDSHDALIAESRRGTNEIKKAIKSKPSSSLNITKDGIFSVYKMGNKVSKYHQKLL